MRLTNARFPAVVVEHRRFVMAAQAAIHASLNGRYEAGQERSLKLAWILAFARMTVMRGGSLPI
jgi:hypothetical protein